MSSSSDADDPTFRKPTATEVFNLRSKCAELGEKMMDRNMIGNALAQEQVSHYDPKTNRCYVELDIHSADLTKYRMSSRYLYDGQTGEMLLSSEWTKDDKSGKVFVDASGNPTMALIDFDAANVKINALMSDDRKR